MHIKVNKLCYTSLFGHIYNKLPYYASVLTKNIFNIVETIWVWEFELLNLVLLCMNAQTRHITRTDYVLSFIIYSYRYWILALKRIQADIKKNSFLLVFKQWVYHHFARKARKVSFMDFDGDKLPNQKYIRPNVHYLRKSLLEWF